MIGALLFAFREQNIMSSIISRGIFLVEQKLQTSDGEETQSYTVRINSTTSETYRIKTNCFDISINGEDAKEVEIISISSSQMTIASNGLRQTIEYHFDLDDLWIQSAGQTHVIRESSPFTSSEVEEDSMDILASMLGKIVAVHVQVGEAVQKGTAICTIEAMKMEHQMCAKADGLLQDLHVKIGDQVKAGQLLGRLTENEVSVSTES